MIGVCRREKVTDKMKGLSVKKFENSVTFYLFKIIAFDQVQHKMQLNYFQNIFSIFSVNSKHWYF